MTPFDITLTDLTCVHDRRPAVHHVSGTFAAGSLTAVVGPNGAGKTTLLRAIAGLHASHEGRIAYGGRTAREVALLPQASLLDRSFPIACRDVVGLGAWSRTGAFRAMPADAVGDVEAALRRVGLEGFAGRLIGTLSAGQFQRVLFARLMLQDAAVMLLDEPFTSVDARTEADLLRLIQDWHAEGRTVVAVLHDIELVQRVFPQTLLLAREAVAWGPTAQVLSAENRMRARLVAEAWVEDAPVCLDAA